MRSGGDCELYWFRLSCTRVRLDSEGGGAVVEGMIAHATRYHQGW
jgi:hypothetical protein